MNRFPSFTPPGLREASGSTPNAPSWTPQAPQRPSWTAAAATSRWYPTPDCSPRGFEAQRGVTESVAAVLTGYGQRAQRSVAENLAALLNGYGQRPALTCAPRAPLPGPFGHFNAPGDPRIPPPPTLSAPPPTTIMVPRPQAPRDPRNRAVAAALDPTEAPRTLAEAQRRLATYSRTYIATPLPEARLKRTLLALHELMASAVMRPLSMNESQLAFGEICNLASNVLPGRRVRVDAASPPGSAPQAPNPPSQADSPALAQAAAPVSDTMTRQASTASAGREEGTDATASRKRPREDSPAPAAAETTTVTKRRRADPFAAARAELSRRETELNARAASLETLRQELGASAEHLDAVVRDSGPALAAYFAQEDALQRLTAEHGQLRDTLTRTRAELGRAVANNAALQREVATLNEARAAAIHAVPTPSAAPPHRNPEAQRAVEALQATLHRFGRGAAG